MTQLASIEDNVCLFLMLLNSLKSIARGRGVDICVRDWHRYWSVTSRLLRKGIRRMTTYVVLAWEYKARSQKFGASLLNTMYLALHQTRSQHYVIDPS